VDFSHWIKKSCVFFAQNAYNEYIRKGLYVSLFAGFVSETTVSRQKAGFDSWCVVHYPFDK
jgi:hypothetical protein